MVNTFMLKFFCVTTMKGDRMKKMFFASLALLLLLIATPMLAESTSVSDEKCGAGKCASGKCGQGKCASGKCGGK